MAAMHAVALPEALAVTGMPRGKIKATIERLNAAGTVSRGNYGGHNSPPVTARDIARYIFGMSALRVAHAATFANTIGALPIYCGDGPPTAEAAAVAIIEGAAFLRPSIVDLDGELIIGITRPGIVVKSGPSIWQYRPVEMPLAAAEFTFNIKLPVVAEIARRLLIEQRN